MLTLLLAGLSILVVGDSHLTAPYYLIDSLHTGLEKQGAEVRSFGVCGTTPSDWVKSVEGTCGAAERTPEGKLKVLPSNTSTVPIDQLIAKYKPDLLVVVLGDTLGGYKDLTFPKTWAWQQVTGLTKAIAKTGTPCIWIGPPWGTEGVTFRKSESRTKQVSAFLATNVTPCEYIDSTQLSKPKEWATSDGQHFTRSGYQAWGNALTRELLASSMIKKLEKK